MDILTVMGLLAIAMIMMQLFSRRRKIVTVAAPRKLAYNLAPNIPSVPHELTSEELLEQVLNGEAPNLDDLESTLIERIDENTVEIVRGKTRVQLSIVGDCVRMLFYGTRGSVRAMADVPVDGLMPALVHLELVRVYEEDSYV